MKLSSSPGRRARASLAGLALVAVLAALTGCVPADSAKFSAFREAAPLGTRICITNKTDMNMRIKWRGYPNARPIAPRFQNCNSGYETGDVTDVAATLEYEPTLYPGSRLRLYVVGDNPAISDAYSAVYFLSGNDQWGTKNLMFVGDETSFQDSWLRVTITRLPDSQRHKEWDVVITPPSGENYSFQLNEDPYFAPS
jgi:hypothetical protein